MKKTFFLFANLILCLNLAHTQTPPKEVLFIGNSYTYFWNLPQTVQAMAEAKGIEMTTRQSTSGGVHWGHHWRGERKLNTRQLLQENNFEAVILQNHSKSTINRLDSMLHFGQLLNREIKTKSGQVFLYLTWAREWDPYMQKEITDGYYQLAKRINASIVPVGPAWDRARQLRPGFPLYDADGSHPSPLGTYLSACVFYGVLTGQSPVGLPNRLISEDKDGEKLYLTIQSSEDALFCQKVAEEIINQMVD